MSEATCKTCPFWTRNADLGEIPGVADPGYCHHARAFPEDEPQRRGDWWCSEHPQRQRDRLAAMAMQGILADGTTLFTNESLAESAYGIADAMLAKARGETP